MGSLGDWSPQGSEDPIGSGLTASMHSVHSKDLELSAAKVDLTPEDIASCVVLKLRREGVLPRIRSGRCAGGPVRASVHLRPRHSVRHWQSRSTTEGVGRGLASLASSEDSPGWGCVDFSGSLNSLHGLHGLNRPTRYVFVFLIGAFELSRCGMVAVDGASWFDSKDSEGRARLVDPEDREGYEGIRP